MALPPGGLNGAPIGGNQGGGGGGPPAPHAASHESGGSDEINVAGLSGVLTDQQPPMAHAPTHSDGGSDEITVENLGTASVDTTQVLTPDGAGGLAFAAVPAGGAPAAHASTHENGGSDEISVAGLSGLLADAQTPTAHASTHSDGGTDEITVENLATASAVTTQVLSPDGAGGLAMRAEDTGGDMDGPGSSVTDSIPTYADTTGKLLKDDGTMRILGGAICVKYTNKTGGATAVGEVFKPDPANANSLIYATIGDVDVVGVGAEASAADGNDLWIAVCGQFALSCDATAVSIGDFMDVGPTAGVAHPHASGGTSQFAMAMTAKGAGAGTVQAIFCKGELF